MSQKFPLLTVQGLSRKFSHRWLWRGVSFEIQAGDCVGLIGASGSGKTLLLRNLVALDPVDKGKIIFANRTLEDWSIPAYRTQVIYSPQRPSLFEGTVEDNLKLIFAFATNRDSTYSRGRIEEYLDILGRDSDFLNLPAPQLSGGESQILALLRILQLNPKILLLDEPTASLDFETTLKVETLLKHWLNSQSDRALLLTSHDSEQIRRVTNRQIHLAEFNAS